MTDETNPFELVGRTRISEKTLSKVIEINLATALMLRGGIAKLLPEIENVDLLRGIKEQVEIAIQKQGPGHLLTRRQRHPYLHA